MPTAVTTLTPSVPASASESYTYEDTSGAIVNAQENPLLSWHANAGDFLYVRSDSVGSNQFTPGKTAPTTGNNTFVFVLRDGRGGEAVLQRDF